jgi:dephospho-CoA kinase
MTDTTPVPYELIGICGHQGSGKNYIGEIVIPQAFEPKSTLVVSFADHFKVEGIVKFGLDYNKVYHNKDYKTRKVLQKTGTEEGRDKYGENIWVDTLSTWMKVYHERGIQRFVIVDVRFPNEVEWLKKVGGTLIKIEAPDRFEERVRNESGDDEERYQSIINHPSEAFIDSIQNCDIFIDNRKNAKDVVLQMKEQLERIKNRNNTN